MERLLRMCLLYLNPRNDDETGGGGGTWMDGVAAYILCNTELLIY